MIVRPKKRRCFEGVRVGLDEMCCAVGSVLSDSRPDVFAVVVNATIVILQVSSHCQSSVDDSLAGSIVDHQVGNSGTWGAVCAVDDGAITIADGWTCVLAAGDKVAVGAYADHSFRLVSIVVEFGLLDKIPNSGASEVVELFDDQV